MTADRRVAEQAIAEIRQELDAARRRREEREPTHEQREEGRHEHTHRR